MGDKFMLDSSVFMTAHRLRYPFDVAPSFWKQLVEKASDKIVIIEKVQKEILRGNDLLADWYKTESNNFTVLNIPDREVINAYRKIISFVNESDKYTPLAKEEFASVADSWLCAYALAYDEIIVTEEIYDANIKNNVKIPNVCEEFGIRCINLLQFIRKIDIVL